MSLRLDHVFICCAAGAPEAQALRAAGLIEGSGNVHPGQGTANRRFFFERGFLELLWVHDAQEAGSAATCRTRLLERWSDRAGAACPFGLCFAPLAAEALALPFESWAYTPGYLPPGRSIRFAEGAALNEPELFALDWTPPAHTATQPVRHPCGLRALQSVSIGLAGTEPLSPPLRAAHAAGLLQIHRSAQPQMVLTFEADQALEIGVPVLGLILRAEPDCHGSL